MNLAENGELKRCRAAGIMSGTSLDGVDVMLEDIFFRGCGESGIENMERIAFATTTYPASLRERLKALSEGRLSSACAGEIAALKRRLAEFYVCCVSEVLESAPVDPATIDILGSHGQTVYHSPGEKVLSLQLDEAAILAERTGIKTVSNFRQRDIAAGGEGAPLVPVVDHLLYTHEDKQRFMVNIGGIANYTYLPAGADRNDIRGSDTGPGNMMIDAAVERLSGGEKKFDRDGQLAAAGEVWPEGIEYLFRHDFFTRCYPRSTGRSDFGKDLLDDFWQKAISSDLAGEDIIATLTEFTVHSICRALRRELKSSSAELCEDVEIIISGGGGSNDELMRRFKLRAAEQISEDVRIINLSSPQKKLPPDIPALTGAEKEAAAFGILAWLTDQRLPGNVPSITGAEREVVLGDITPSH